MGTTHGASLVVGFLVNCDAFFAGQKTEANIEVGQVCRIPVLGGFTRATVAICAKGEVSAVKLSDGTIKKLTKKEREKLDIERPNECWKLPDGTTTDEFYKLIQDWAEELDCSIEQLIGSDTLAIELSADANKAIMGELSPIDLDEEYGLGGCNAHYESSTIRAEYVTAALPQLVALRQRFIERGFPMPRHPAIHSVLTVG